MIKFFRKIRQKLLTENKFSKYLIYAIGEIILVVIGILIALSINNWNQQRKELVKEQAILKQLKSEYEKNLVQLDEKILMRNQIIQASTSVLNYIDNPVNVNPDSLFHQLDYIIRDPTFDPIKNDVNSSGNLRLIRNIRLNQLLSNWSSDIYQVQEMELQWQKIRTEIILPFNIKTGISRDIHNLMWKDGYAPPFALDKGEKVFLKINKSKKTLSIKQILNHRELEGIAANAISFNSIGNIQSLALRNRIIEILKIIKNEIKNEG